MTQWSSEEQVNELIDAAVTPLRVKLAQLEATVERLQAENARLRKNSSTSSKPPSSDIVKPKRTLPRGGKKRRRGGQSGHDQHLRTAFRPEDIDEFTPDPKSATA